MSKRIFRKEQIDGLRRNPNVAGCSDKSIMYHKAFKVSAVKQYHEGLSPNEIFKQAGFNLDVIGFGTPKECMRRWRKTFKEKGEEGLKADGRKANSKGRPKVGRKNDKEKIKYLEAKVAYLKAENDFLAKLRKKS